MKEKVRIFGDKKSVVLEQLEAYIPRQNIPNFLGGDSSSALGSDADSLWTEVDAVPAAGTNGEDPFLDDLAVGKACHRAGMLNDVGSSPSRGTTGRKATAVTPGEETVEKVKGRTQKNRRGRVAATCDRKSRSSRRHGERTEGSAASCTPGRKGEGVVCREAVKRGKEGRAGEGEIGSGGTLTALRKVFKRVLGGILMIGEALLRVVKSVLRLLRDVFFEQVEVEEEF